jgi:ribosomal protein S18 acetylase RimI-like enzyme
LDVRLRIAGPGDEHALALVASAAFLETYAHIIPGADLVHHCQTRHTAAVYAAWLGESDVTIWLAETALGSPAGYLVLTQATLPLGAARPGDREVQRIYVLSRYHGTGLGHALMQLAIDKARSLGAERLVLGVHNDNNRALAFYAREGFAIIDKRQFHVGLSVCCDSVLAQDLR